MPNQHKSDRVRAQPNISASNKRSGYKWLGVSMDQVKEKPATPCNNKLRELGKKAHAEGGFAKMQTVWRQLRRRGVRVGYAWDGIGGWYA